jgi:hypothetical protein
MEKAHHYILLWTLIENYGIINEYFYGDKKIYFMTTSLMFFNLSLKLA